MAPWNPHQNPLNWLVVWLPSIFYFPRNIENNHHPNWRTHICQRGSNQTTNQMRRLAAAEDLQDLELPQEARSPVPGDDSRTEINQWGNPGWIYGWCIWLIYIYMVNWWLLNGFPKMGVPQMEGLFHGKSHRSKWTMTGGSPIPGKHQNENGEPQK